MIDRLLALQAFGIKLGLEGIGRLCEALGHPERAFTALHVAGTNGKGSVAALTHAALHAAGIRAGRYTSPHLSDLSERFVVGARPVTAAELDEVGRLVLDRADALVRAGALPAPPTFFEATTAIAFELFRRAGVEAAVIEVGLGGRFDATNVVGARLGAITSVGLDHQEHLGDTLASIAGEKAGILKPGMTAVTGDLPPEAAEVVAGVAAHVGARLVSARAGARVEVEEIGDGRLRLAVTTPAGRYGPLVLALRGQHQVGNALVAIRLLEAAREAGLAVPDEAVEAGLARAEWPARLEPWTLAGGLRLLVDAAHNADGAATLAAYLRRWHPERPVLIVAAMRDKDLDAMLRHLLPVTGAVVATAPPMDRALAPEEVAACVRRLDAARLVEIAHGPGEALDRAAALGASACAAGSIFLAGAVRDAARPRAILRDVPASS